MRSAFLMTEPAVASSDATNIQTRIHRDGDEWVISGHKWWISGTGDPRCKIGIVMGKTDPTAATHQQQSMILVPLDTPGIEILRDLTVFGYNDREGHCIQVHGGAGLSQDVPELFQGAMQLTESASGAQQKRRGPMAPGGPPAARRRRRPSHHRGWGSPRSCRSRCTARRDHVLATRRGHPVSGIAPPARRSLTSNRPGDTHSLSYLAIDR